MANPEHLKILKQGANAWNKWRKENPAITPDLNLANVSGAERAKVDLSVADIGWADLGRRHFYGADLSKAGLRGADLQGVELGRAYLGGADLSKADLASAILVHAYLGGANLNGAYLHDANLNGANLNNADFTDARMGTTVFGDNDLSTVKGLETMRHSGPSTIGFDTIYKSKGNIPEVFLRGCAVPEDFIVYMKSLVGKAIDFYSCFISYSSQRRRLRPAALCRLTGKERSLLEVRRKCQVG